MRGKKTRDQNPHYVVRLYRSDGQKRSFYFRGAYGNKALALAKARAFVAKAYDFSSILIYDCETDSLAERYNADKVREYENKALTI